MLYISEWRKKHEINISGSNLDTSGFFDGRIYSMSVYNRGLTEDEVAQNAQIALNKANNN